MKVAFGIINLKFKNKMYLCVRKTSQKLYSDKKCNVIKI